MSVLPDPSSDPLLGLYKQPDLRLVSGCGCEVVDSGGKVYLDFTSGIGVNALGHASPVFRAAVLRALESGLVHTSNLYRTAPGEELARLLLSLSFPGKVFFCNSGAEAGEAAFKFARRWGRSKGGDAKVGFTSFEGAFHGRLFGTLAATARVEYRTPFEPLMPGMRFARVGDPGSVRAVSSREGTAAVVIETIQGEGGVRPVPAGFLRELRAFCDEEEILLVIDEVQCGFGRSGHFFAFEHAGVVPDLLVLAKPIAGGLPMGAVVVAPHVAAELRPGDHGTTFGGGPFLSTVALAVVRHLSDPEFLDRVRALGAHLETRLRDLQRRVPGVREIRGMGLMRGIELEVPVAAVTDAARARGLLVVGAGPDTIRLLPPLVVTEEEIDRAVEILGASIRFAMGIDPVDAGVVQRS